MFTSLLRFLVYSNLFIAGCATLMVIQTSQLLLQSQVNSDYLFFVFFSTLCSYSFHWYLTENTVLPSPRTGWLVHYRWYHVVLFIAGLAGSVVYFFFLSANWHWLLVAVIITFLYSAPKIPHPLFRSLRKAAVGKTIFLASAWTYVTTVIPVILSGKGFGDPEWYFIGSRFFLVYAICILFDYRDREDDKARGVRSLITWLSEKNISRLFIITLLLFAISTAALYFTGIPVNTVIVLLIPGIIAAMLYNYARQHFSDMLYYFILDGLMALSALLMLVMGI